MPCLLPIAEILSPAGCRGRRIVFDTRRDKVIGEGLITRPLGVAHCRPGRDSRALSGKKLAMTVWFEGMSLPVADLDRSVAFYKSLGFALEGRSPRFALLRLGAGTIGLLAIGAPAAAAGQRLRALVQVELSTDDLDGLYNELLARGLPVRPPKDRPWERQMQVRDPDGFTVEFSQGRRSDHVPD
jgi:catechol 2,3-dioxygenase-like lactoylglutathione lyase family enzyme